MNKYLEKVSNAKILAAKTVGAAIGIGGSAALGMKALDHTIKKEQEKMAGVQDWIDDVSGRKVKTTETVLTGLRHAAATGKTYSQYEMDLRGLKNATAKARLQAGGVGVAALGAGMYGFHSYKEHQKKKILESYQNLYKKAGLGSEAFKAGGKVLKTGVKALKNVGNAAADTLNTAGGGKVKTFANNSGIRHGSRQMKEFNNATHPEKLQILKAKLGKPGAPRLSTKTPLSERALKSKEMRTNFKQLTRDQTNARIVAGAIPAAGVLGYRRGKREDSDHEVDYY
jgi:hypothetical protein